MNDDHAKTDYTVREIDELVAEWQAIGRNMKGFCKSRNLNYDHFRRWCYARGIKRTRKSPEEKESAANFIPIELPMPGTMVPVIEVSYPDGRKVSFYTQPEVQLLQMLLI